MQAARLLPADKLDAAFRAAGIDPSRPIVCTCGSGLSAAILALALHQATGGKLVPIYDGSFCEWGAREDTPLVTGP